MFQPSELHPRLGSPPRMRGKAKRRPGSIEKFGITPAYAGKSLTMLPTAFVPRDHPRVCGEKGKGGVLTMAETGSPPRMRGKVGGAKNIAGTARITPAYAGKSLRHGDILHRKGDHPRVCGEKGYQTSQLFALMGSPPRMRGKEPAFRPHVFGRGITPAYAGKRARGMPSRQGWRDHPRVCGEKTKKIP